MGFIQRAAAAFSAFGQPAEGGREPSDRPQPQLLHEQTE
jgi:hypothetical protein